MRDRIGIYTGSFNPIHNAHLRIAEIAKEAFKLDIVFFEACNDYYDKDDLVPVHDRMKMLKLAMLHVPAMTLGCHEASQATVINRQPYTIETLDYYRQEYPDAEIFYICGGDVLDYIREFHDIDKLLENHKVICISREGNESEKIVDMFNLDVKGKGVELVTGIIGKEFSGTAIRELVSKGYTIRWRVPEGVRDYILEHGLYK